MRLGESDTDTCKIQVTISQAQPILTSINKSQEVLTSLKESLSVSKKQDITGLNKQGGFDK